MLVFSKQARTDSFFNRYFHPITFNFYCFPGSPKRIALRKSQTMQAWVFYNSYLDLLTPSRRHTQQDRHYCTIIFGHKLIGQSQGSDRNLEYNDEWYMCI